MPRRRFSTDDYLRGLAAGDSSILAQAITLVESTKAEDVQAARALLQAVHGRTGSAHRVGISGVPGVGKSTFIEALGTKLVADGHQVAVLAVDPSSSLSGGSILGDKSRMNSLAMNDAAFIRPSPSAQNLGGVAKRTRESVLLCEAAGFDVILVETVGVGQSETMVADMVDFFLVLMLPGAGDELQGIKKGILELADLIAVNKADGELLPKAREAVTEYAAALRYLRPKSDHWQPRALLISALTKTGLDELWVTVLEHHAALQAAGAIQENRQTQLRRWLWQEIDQGLHRAFHAHLQVQEKLQAVEADVLAGRISPSAAAEDLLAIFKLG